MIVVLLNCFINLLQAQTNNNNIFPVEKGYDIISADTNKVLIPISVIKQANVKLNERLHLINIVSEQELIISDYKLYTITQDSIIKEFQNRIINANKINENYYKEIEKQRNRKDIWKGTAIGAIISTVLVFLLK